MVILSNSISKYFSQLLPSRQNILWKKIINSNKTLWQKSVNSAKQGPKVLIAISMGGFNHGVMLESSLAVALTLRKANVEILLCDNFLPCCQLTKYSKSVLPEILLKGQHTPRCNECVRSGKNAFNSLGLKIQHYSNYCNLEEKKLAQKIATELPLKQIQNYRYQDLAVGEHAYAGALRYYGRGDLENEPLGEQILRRYLYSSILSVIVTQNLLNKNKYDVAVFNHGIYVPQGLIGEVCRKTGIRVVNWNPSYRKQTFIFSHDDSYHHTMISEPTNEWKDIELTPEIRQITHDYLKSRWQGSGDWIWFHEKPVEDVHKIAEEIGLDLKKPCIGLLTNVMWDAQLHYKSNAFKNMLDWVFQTIDYFAKHSEMQLIIRVHPAEIRGMVPSRQKLVPEIQKKFPNLPKNIFIISPESQVSTYAVMAKCKAVIIYNTKTGIEVSCMGIPVIVAGEAWIRNKGFSIDATSPEQYVEILNKLPNGYTLSKEKLDLAYKYAFHFFFRRMIELPFIDSPKKFEFSLKLNDLPEMLPGHFPGLDLICDGILNNNKFIYKGFEKS